MYLFSIAVVSFLLAFVLTPFIRNYARKRGFVDMPDERRRHARPVPRTGGIGIFAAYLTATALGQYLFSSVLPPAALTLVLGVAGAALIVFATGLWDDIRRISPSWKLAGQFVAANVAFVSGVQIHVVHNSTVDPWISYPLTVLWLIACSNAFNLIDGMDGLASGVALLSTITMLIAALTYGNIGLAILTVPLAGALIGFLRYNFAPATVFLGDCGSLSIGFLLGCYGVLWGHKSATLLGMTAPVMALAVPLVDTSLAVIRRVLRGQSVFKADRGHIHHRLLDLGLSVRTSTFVIYGVGAAAALFSIMAHSNHRHNALVVILFVFAISFGIRHLGYAEFDVTRRLVTSGGLQRIVAEQVKIDAFRAELAAAQSSSDGWRHVSSNAKDFGFAGVTLRISGRIFEHHPFVEEPSVIHIPLTAGDYLEFYYIAAEQPVPCLAFAEATRQHFAGQLQPRLVAQVPAALPDLAPPSAERVPA